LPINYTL